MSTVLQMQSKVEVWKNTAAGMRWYIAFDLQGRESSKTVPGGRTFTLSTFERQINQERTADPSQDLFRNGTFTLAKPSEDTVNDEIASPNALTDQEIEEIVREVVFGDKTITEVIKTIDSTLTLHRLWEAFVLEEKTPDRVTKAIKRKKDSLEPTVANPREAVVTSPEE